MAGAEDYHEVGPARPSWCVSAESRGCGTHGLCSSLAIDAIDHHPRCQVERIHAYKRHLLNALRVVVLYNRLWENPHFGVTPQTFFFAGNGAPADQLAKLINNRASTIDGNRARRDRLGGVCLPESDVSLTEWLIPAGDVSNQMSTAGDEARRLLIQERMATHGDLSLSR